VRFRKGETNVEMTHAGKSHKSRCKNRPRMAILQFWAMQLMLISVY